MPTPRAVALMGRRANPPGYLCFAVLAIFLLLVPSRALRAQSLSFETSTMHDENVFDIYDPSPDQITQFEADASDDWDFVQFSLSAGYS